MNRRLFLGLAPTILLATVLPEPRRVYSFGGLERDDTAYLQALINERLPIPPGMYTIGSTLDFTLAGPGRMVSDVSLRFAPNGRVLAGPAQTINFSREPLPSIQLPA